MPTQKALFLVDPAGTLAVREYPVPTPGPGEILVEIHAAALNPVDWKMEEDKLVKEYPAVIGIDAAGIVHALGEGVTGLVVGDKVCVLNRSLVGGRNTDAIFQPASGVLHLSERVVPAVRRRTRRAGRQDPR